MVYDYLPLDQHSKKPLYQQLYEQIRRAVQEGHLSQGYAKTDMVIIAQ